MKPTLLTILLVLSLSSFAQEPSPAIERYHQHLTEYLRNHYDPNIQLKAYLLPFKTVNHEKLKLLLKSIINLSSDKYSIFLADNICHSLDELTEWCHEYDIHAIRRQIDPKNLNTYMYELAELKDGIEIELLLDRAAEKSNYADSFFFHHIKETVDQINIFNQQNENLYTDYLSFDNLEDEDFIKKLREDINNSYLFEKEYSIDEMELEFSKSATALTATAFNMAYTTPSLRHLTQACKKIENTEACLDLSETMIPSKTLLYQNIGFYLKVEALKTLKKDKKVIQQAEQKKQQFSDTWNCYSQTKDITLATYFSLDFTDQYLNDLATAGDFNAWKNLSLKAHQIQVDNGLITDFDPKNCEY